ncbi:Z1 domain-containing protein [Rhodococcus sp. 3Y1]
MRALDSFVLTGAIKLFRESKGAKPYRHHTMLVHESVKQAEHDAVADDFKALWKSAGYSQAKSLSRLDKLWAEDFAVVSAARGSELENPGSFAELEEFIGAAYDKISEGTSPVIVVNGAAEKDYKQDSLDFQERGVWKILVGGTKLSRGFTVEGLTITYYTRRTGQADTLMQMGRWFGFRPGTETWCACSSAARLADPPARTTTCTRRSRRSFGTSRSSGTSSLGSAA